MRILVIIAALLGMTGVAAGAFGAHALSARLAPDRLELWETAARYQLLHALALLGAAWIADRFGGSALLAGWMFVVGTLVFSGTVYALALGAPRWLGAVTPIGGLALILGWGLLAWSAWRGGAS